MAKRKRLTPANPISPQETPALETKPRPFSGGSVTPPPIAQVSAQAAAASALEEISAMVSQARADGRLLEALPLEAIVMDHLMRDRMGLYGEELDILVASIRTRGQTTPVEVTPLPDQPGRYGLISGYRRMAALQRLAEEDPSLTVRAQIVRPETAQAAYIAMVEENEVRVDLSPYERAHMVVRALDAGLFPDQKEALQTLYEHVTRSKRSKIGALVPLVRALGDALRHPAHLSERMGLALVKATQTNPDAIDRLEGLLRAQDTPTPAEEAALIERVLQGKPVLKSHDAKAPAMLPGRKAEIPAAPIANPEHCPSPQVSFDAASRTVRITGADPALFEAVKACVRDHSNPSEPFSR
jgi:ParB/RepB/Spo0J family partition protein